LTPADERICEVCKINRIGKSLFSFDVISSDEANYVINDNLPTTTSKFYRGLFDSVCICLEEVKQTNHDCF